MPVKKAARTKKPARGKRPMGLTSALGPKTTTMVVIVVLAGGIMVGARQQQTRAKDRLDRARADVALAAEPTAKKHATASTPMANTASPAASPAPTAGTSGSAAAKPVTVVGCLERTDEGFRLKETSGADAPKARSWKSGFLKKSSASLDVVDTTRTLQLNTLVGRRVSMTGIVDDRELQARSVRRLGECKAN